MFGDERDKVDYKGQRSTMPPRQRPGTIYAGGKKLRRTMKLLGERQKAHGLTSSNGASRAKDMQRTNPPGSMQV
jgi:hypothetical protein